jgi:hypothetical protein
MKKLILTFSAVLLTALSFAQIRATTDKKGNLCLENKGKIVVKENFEKVGTYDWDAALIPAKLNGKWGFYNEEGKLIIPHTYEGMMFQNVAALSGWYDTKQNSIQVFLGGKKMFIDKAGKEISEPLYDLVVETTHTGAGFFFKKDGKWALADKDKKVITEFKYDQIRGPIGVNPFVYKGTRDGKDFRINANGEEEAEISTPVTNNNSTDKKDDNAKCNYKCQKCNKITQGSCNASNTGITVENCTAQQPDPNGPRKNHEWRKQ